MGGRARADADRAERHFEPELVHHREERREALPFVSDQPAVGALAGAGALVMDGADLAQRLRDTDAAVIMKVGRHLPKIRRALAEAGRAAQALYVERGTMVGERIAPLADVPDGPAPYFSLVLIPGRRGPR